MNKEEVAHALESAAHYFEAAAHALMVGQTESAAVAAREGRAMATFAVEMAEPALGLK